MRRLATVVPSLLAAGCSVIPNVETTEFRDDGEACVLPADGADGADFPIAIGPEDDLVVEVFFPTGCLSSSCDEVLEASCEATVDGQRIVVTSSGTLERDVGASACTKDCGIMSARCELPDLDAGTYTIVHGDDEETFELPGTPDCSGGF